MLCRDLDGCGPVATDTTDVAAGPKEKKHKALDAQEAAAREGDGGDERNNGQQGTKGKAKGKKSKRVVVVAGKGNSGRKGKASVSQPQPGSASPPPALKGGRHILQLRYRTVYHEKHHGHPLWRFSEPVFSAARDTHTTEMVASGRYHRDVSLGASLDVRTLPAVVILGLGVRPRAILSPGCDTVSSTAVVSLFGVLGREEACCRKT